jgi:S1-C subfamily serine protease
MGISMLRIGTLLTALVVATPVLAETNRDCASNNHPVAIRACTQLINQNPRNATAYYNRGISYRETGKIDLALADYNRAIEINPRYFEAFNNRGNIYMARGDNRRALQEFDQAITINPQYAVAHNNRGEAYENMNQLEDAMTAYNRAIELNPRYARAYANRGDIWRKMGQRENAVADYRYALSLDARNALALAGLKTLGVGASASAPSAPPPPGAGQALPGAGQLNPVDPEPSFSQERTTRPPQQQQARTSPQPPAQPQEKRGSTGTGFFVSPQGHVLTNHHVVESCSDIIVALEGSIPQSARVIGRDSKNDLALLATNGLKPGTVPNLRMGARLGESVYVYGFPLAGLLASSGNFTIGNITAVAGLGDDTTMIQMSAPVQPGNSGGPVLDQNGNVIAIVVSKLNALRIAKVTSDIPQNVNFAIKSLIAMSFLETGSVTPSAAASTTKLETTQIAERARTFTAQIRCN